MEWEAYWGGRWKKLGPATWFRVERGQRVQAWVFDKGDAMPSMPELNGLPELPLVPADPGGWGKLYPELAGWLCDAYYPDKKPIGQTQLTVRRKGHHVVVQLKIADQGGLKVEAYDENLDKALGLLEAVLRGKPVPWQRDDFPLGQGGKKKK